MKLTPRQREYVVFMRQFLNENDQLPPVAVLAKAMGVTGNAADEALKRIERAGYIKRNSVGKYMFCRRP